MTWNFCNTNMRQTNCFNQPKLIFSDLSFVIRNIQQIKDEIVDVMYFPVSI